MTAPLQLASGGDGAVPRLEEAFHLLRRMPKAGLANYYIGTLPFVLSLLYFVQDMSLHTFAHRRVAAGAMILAAFFAWMKFWQSRFAGAMAAFQAGVEPPPASGETLWRQTAHQTIVQSAAMMFLFVAALAASVVAPNGHAGDIVTVMAVLLFLLLAFEAIVLVCHWRVFLPITGTMSFFQHVTILADGRRPLREALAQSARLAKHGDGASAGLPLLALMACLLLANLSIVLLAGPHLLQQILGVGTEFSRGGSASANTTLFGIAVALTFLMLDPMNRALHVLSCFYATADRSGQDLRGRFLRAKSADATEAGGAAILAALLAITLALPAAAAPAAEDLAAQLDRSIEKTLADGNYAWRPERDNPNAGMLESISNTFTRWGQDLRDWFRAREDQSTPGPRGGGGKNFSGPDFDGINLPAGESVVGGLQLILYLLLAVAIVALVVVIAMFLRSHLRRDEKTDDADDASPIQAKPDLSRDDTTADQLPEEGWLGMAAELFAKKQYRLAMRAMYLACLAGLAQREMVKIVRSKSNHEYVRELRRRSHAAPGMMEPFEENVAAFERAWYGMHDVTADAVRRFRDNQRRMVQLTARLT